jgi:ArsR family transcriptional regulator
MESPRFPADLPLKARIFKALGDEVRMKLLFLLRDEEVCVCDLMDVMGMAQGTLSHHLNVLLQAGLVTARRRGRWNYYQATGLAKNPWVLFEPEAVKAKP